MKLWPLLAPGGISPVNAYFRHSMMVVFPHPFWPTISESGELKTIPCSSPLSTPKLRMPRINSFSIVDMVRQRRTERDRERKRGDIDRNDKEA